MKERMTVKKKAAVVAEVAPVPEVVEKSFVRYGLTVFALFST